jgi:hypothetical protein
MGILQGLEDKINSCVGLANQLPSWILRQKKQSKAREFGILSSL